MLAHVGPAQCDAGCTQALLDMRQARLALGKDARRVARWWLVTGRPEARALAGVRGAYPGMRVGLIGSDSILSTQPEPSAAIQLVDPAGLLILRYSGGSVAADVLKDLKRLLKISTQG
jgi:hypothetical protein